MSDRRPSAPDYTTAALVMGFVNLLWMLAVIRALFGMPAVLGVGWLLNLGIDRLGVRPGR